MKKLITLLMLVYLSASIHAQTQIKVTLDTKKFINIDCSLGADGAGSPSVLPKVYMHSGLCTYGDIYCKTQITPLNSLVWEHVVGNWGTSPQDDEVGVMAAEGNGVYSITFIVEDYFSGPLVSTAFNDAGTLQSTPMPQGATPYTLGLVFRNPDGLITGRDNMCNDIFVTDINTTNPKVIQSFDLNPWPNSPVTIERTVIGIDEIKNINFFSVAPNPVKDQLYIEFYLNEGTSTTVTVFDNFGKKIATLLEDNLKPGKHIVKSNIEDLEMASGIYFITVKTDFSMVTEKVVVIK